MSEISVTSETLEIILYIGAKAMSDATYVQISDSLPPVAKVALIRSVKQLECELRGNRRNQLILVAAPDGRQDLMEMSALEDLLTDINLLIIMPLHIETETIDLAHRLYPRYLCFRPYCFSHLEIVIANICQSTEAKTRMTELKN